ncbi:MAG: N-acetyltransferase family protein [Bacillota bacterium]|nr:N-acetyltransferase family protein [Bacillota bacterium]
MVNIRDAVLEDLPGMLKIYNDAVKNLTATFDLEEYSLEQRTVWFHQHGGRFPLIVAMKDDVVAGYCCLSPYRDKPAYSRSSELSIYISKGFRGKGIGTLLMKEIINRAKLLRYHTLIGGITSGNEASVKLHKKFGFTFIGRFKEVGFKFEEWQHVDFYQLIFAD